MKNQSHHVHQEQMHNMIGLATKIMMRSMHGSIKWQHNIAQLQASELLEPQSKAVQFVCSKSQRNR